MPQLDGVTADHDIHMEQLINHFLIPLNLQYVQLLMD
jgi:hypothetical protein